MKIGRTGRMGQGMAAAACLLAMAGSAGATYVQYGEGMQTILSGTLEHGGFQMETAMTWANDIPYGTTYAVTSSFSGAVADDIHVARLALTLWGGTRDYTATVTVKINGETVPFASVTLGTTGDANPSFDADAASVYGTGYGVWLVTLPVPTNSVNRDGSANVFEIEVADSTGQFDKRVMQATFLSVYEQVSLAHQLSWFIAEGSGDIYRGTTGAVAARDLTLGATPSGTVSEAALYALYTYGDSSQNDRLLFNGTSIGGDNVADKADDYAGLNYAPDLVSFDVTSLLASDNTVRFTVDAADGVPDTRESSLRPSLAALVVTQPIPEPVGVSLVLAGVAAMLACRRRA